MSEIGILGAGGMAKEAARYSSEHVAFFALNSEYLLSDNTTHTGAELIDIERPDAFQQNLKVVAALGAPAIRRSMIQSWPGNKYTNIISKSAEVFTDQTSTGLIIGPQSVITTDTNIGNHSIINVGATISHDCDLGEYVTISPGVHIGGNVKLGDGVFIGIGAVIKNGITIAEGSVIGAGSVVIKNIDTPNSIAVGNPAKIIRVGEGWLDHV